MMSIRRYSTTTYHTTYFEVITTQRRSKSNPVFSCCHHNNSSWMNGCNDFVVFKNKNKTKNWNSEVKRSKKGRLEEAAGKLGTSREYKNPYRTRSLIKMRPFFTKTVQGGVKSKETCRRWDKTAICTRNTKAFRERSQHSSELLTCFTGQNQRQTSWIKIDKSYKKRKKKIQQGLERNKGCRGSFNGETVRATH